MIDLNAEPRPVELPVHNLRQLIDCRVGLELGHLRGTVRTIDDCLVAFLTVGRRRWEGLQVAVFHHNCLPNGKIDLSGPIPQPVMDVVMAMFRGLHFHSESIDLDEVTKVRVRSNGEVVAFLECNGTHPFAHFPGEVCPIHFGDEPDQPTTVAGFDVPDDISELTEGGDDGEAQDGPDRQGEAG